MRVKVAKDYQAAYRMAMDRLDFRTPLVRMMDGGYGHRAGGKNYACGYLIYSYGEHWPLYVYDRASQQWIGNKERHGPTTNRHMTRFRPNEPVGLWLSTDVLTYIAMHGLAAWTLIQLEDKRHG